MRMRWLRRRPPKVSAFSTRTRSSCRTISQPGKGGGVPPRWNTRYTVTLTINIGVFDGFTRYIYPLQGVAGAVTFWSAGVENESSAWFGGSQRLNWPTYGLTACIGRDKTPPASWPGKAMLKLKAGRTPRADDPQCQVGLLIARPFRQHADDSAAREQRRARVGHHEGGSERRPMVELHQH